MKFPPIWTKTEQITKLLYDIDVLHAAYGLHKVPEQHVLQLQRRAVLKSSLYSARIEGNPLSWQDVIHADLVNPQERHMQEISNIAIALEEIRRANIQSINLDILRRLHAIVLRNISSEAGHFRIEESAIYNQAGIAVYLAPAPDRVKILLTDWCQYCNDSTDPDPVKAAVSHIWFEKIHPFLDGNGRVGRIVSSILLHLNGYDFGGLSPLEEYIDTNRDLYYQALSIESQDVTDFICFFLTVMFSQGKTSIEESLNPPLVPYLNLLPRRAEIVALVKDHKMVSFDFILRRFRAVPESSLHNDITQLMRGGYIKKLGSTRGAEYVLGEKAENSI